MVARFASYYIGRAHAVFFVGKYFVVRLSTMKTTKILPPEKYPLYGMLAEHRSLSEQVATLLSHEHIITMKSTKVQNPRRITAYLASSLESCVHASARARELATPRVSCSCNAWCCPFSLQHGLAASVAIVLGKAECC